MMGTYIELLSNFVQVFMLIYFITKAFGYKKDMQICKFGFIVAVCVVFLELSFINHVAIYDGFLSGISIVTVIIYARVCLKGSIPQQIFVVTLSMAIIFTIGNAVLFLFSYIAKVNIKLLIVGVTKIRIVIILVSRILEWLIFSYVLHINAEYDLSLREWCMFASMPLLTWAAVTLIMQSSMKMQYIQPQMFYIVLIMIAINIVIFFFMYKVKQDTKTKLEYELLKLQYDNIKKMEANMKALFENTYSVKHDLEKHLLALKMLAQKKQCDEIEEYIENIFDKNLNAVQKIVFTDNDVFNAIVNTKLELCHQKNIFPSVMISNEAISHIKMSDIAVLFGNIFDNAIEACEKTDKKIILLNIQLQGEYVSIYMENSFCKEYSDVHLKTTKKDKYGHGLGTKIVQKIVEENGGMVQYFETDAGMFCCDILLKKC